MGKYTSFFSREKYTFDFTFDEGNTDHLIAVTKNFREFDKALDQFLYEHGYDNSVSQVDFIISKFKEKGIEFDKRNIVSYYEKHRRPKDKSFGFACCLAFDLSLEESEDFFRRIYLCRFFDLHDPKELVYYYVLKNKLSYTRAKALLEMLPQIKKDNLNYDKEIYYTSSILEEINKMNSDEQLLEYLTQNSELYQYNNATAYQFIQKLWQEITKLVPLEKEKLSTDEFSDCSGHLSSFDIYKHILYLSDYQVETFKLDEGIKPILDENGLVHPLATKSFPNHKAIDAIMRGEHKSEETVRKILILLLFYEHWARLALSKCENYYEADQEDVIRMEARMNKYLTDARYPTLYEGNPYDWIFLFCNQCEEPLVAFRTFIHEVYLIKEEGLE